jgi:hypothetical protein
MHPYPYYYAWRNNSKRLTLYRRRCRIVARGKMNSRLVEFERRLFESCGQREVVSGNAIRRVRDVRD